GLMKNAIVLPRSPRICGSLSQPRERTDRIEGRLSVASRHKEFIEILCYARIGVSELNQRRKQIGIVRVTECCLYHVGCRYIQLDVRQDLVVGCSDILVLTDILPRASLK